MTQTANYAALIRASRLLCTVLLLASSAVAQDDTPPDLHAGLCKPIEQSPIGQAKVTAWSRQAGPAPAPYAA